MNICCMKYFLRNIYITLLDRHIGGGKKMEKRDGNIKMMKNKKILGRRLTVILLAMTMTFFLPVTVQSEVVPDHWNYYATYDFDLLESNSRISAVRVVAHIDGTTVKVDTNIDDTPEYTFTLNEGDMWENDLPTGTHIWSTEELTVHQYDDYQWDYKEVILPAVRFWDNDYYYGGVISFKLGTNHILITAAYDNTYVAIDLDNDGTPDLTNTLNEGQVWDISAAATTLSGESLPGGRWVGYDTRAGAHIYTTTDNTFTTPGGNVIQVHAYATMQEWFGSAYNIIPTTSLGKEYIFPRVDCLNPLYWDRADKMIFVATEPSTTVNIDKDHDGATDVTINLANVGNWDYWPHGSIDNAWSHGAYVSANEEIVAFYSSPGGGRYWDGFMSQMVPKLSTRSDYWNSNGLSTDRSWSTPYIHFFAYEDGTTLYRDTDNDGTADFTYNLDFLDGGLKITASKEGEHFWVDDPDNHHVTMYQRHYYTASDTMSPISYQVLEQQDTIPPGKVSDLNAQAVSLSPTGFVYPTGKQPTLNETYNYGGDEAKTYYKYYEPDYTNNGGWLARGDKGDYAWGKYHIAQDIKSSEGDSVFAILGGVVRSISYDPDWSHDPTDNNIAILIEHTLDDGTKFLALYGHIHSSVKKDDEVLPGQPFATIGPFGDYEHLHFGIRPGTYIPPSHWGALPLTDWENENEPPTETNGFVDPIEWIDTMTPKSPVSPECAVVLSWTAPADDGHDKQSGSASSYDIRYSTHEITEENWESATKCTGEPVPGTPGDRETFVVTNLYTAYSYHFAMKSYDEMGIPSELSNDVWEITHGVGWASCSPADIIVEDPDGLIISSDVNEIPGATYIEIDYNGDGILDKVVMIPDKKIGDYIITVVPEPDADPTDTYSLFSFSDGIIIVLADDILISGIPSQPYIIRSTETEIFQIIPVTIDINPNTLNLNSTGNWITCYIELPNGYNVEDINISTFLLNDIIPAEVHPTNISDYDNDGIPDLMVKFDRQAVQDILERGENVEITVTGEIADGTLFEGIDYIRVI